MVENPSDIAHDCLSKISMLKYLVIMFVTFPIRYDIDKSDPTKEAANLTDTLLNFSKLYSILIVSNSTYTQHIIMLISLSLIQII
jgi:hypothetical protein